MFGYMLSLSICLSSYVLTSSNLSIEIKSIISNSFCILRTKLFFYPEHKFINTKLEIHEKMRNLSQMIKL